MALPYNPSTVGYGTPILAINSVNYVVETITVNKPAKKVTRNTELGAPSDILLIRDWQTGSATVQLATGTTATPNPGDTFVANIDRTGNTNFVVTDVSLPQSQDEIHKVSFDFSIKP
jgi:hypothetical protein